MTDIGCDQKSQQFAVMARPLVMATLPHGKQDELYFQRKNGHYTLTMMANPQYGLPYGSLARLILVWIATEAYSRKSPEIYLGKSLAAFLKKLSLRSSGGVRGNAIRVRQQLMRLLTCGIAFDYYDTNKGICKNEQYLIGRAFQLWWDPINCSDIDFKSESKITLSSDFYEQLIKHPVPVDFIALKQLRGSPMQIDIYVWLTYRFSFLKGEAFIPWKLIIKQFGADYASDRQGIRNFKKKFQNALKHVWQVYPEANVCPDAEGLMLFESKTHIRKKLKRVDNPVDISAYPR